MNLVYILFWDKRGSLHWGLFNKNENSLEEAYDNLNNLFSKHLNRSKQILNIGSGNGYVDLELANKHGFQITGIDLSPRRIEYANKLKESYSEIVQKNVDFIQGSATCLPFPNQHFEQVMSQSTFYHVHDKEKLFQEIFRVLSLKGLLVFDDLFKPKKEISENAKINVYERLLFDTPFDFESYQIYLEKNKFKVVCAKDLTNHLYKTYDLLKKRLEKEKNFFGKDKLIEQYEGTLKAIEGNELGWGWFKCQKI